MKVLAYRFIVSCGLVFVVGCATTSPTPETNATPVIDIKPAQRAAPPKEKDDDIVVKPIKIIQTPEVEELTADQVIEPSFPAATAAAEPAVQYPTQPNVYLVQAKTKNATHPKFHDGNPMGFVLNGVQGRDVVIKRGQILTFQVRTGVQHDFYITTSPAGWGAGAYTDGVKGQFTYDGDVTVTADKSTPDILYYGCRNHKSMGGQIFVVNTDKESREKQAEIDKAREEHIANSSQKSAPSAADENKLKQKIAYATMLLQIKNAALSSEQKKNVQQKIESAKKSQSNGDIAGGIATIDEAVNVINGKVTASGPSEQELAEQKADYEAIYLTAKSFQDSHEASYTQAKKEKRKAVDYDHKQVDQLFVEAEKLAKQKQYEEAERKISKAERLITVALNEMLSSQTLVYEVKFETPKDEFDYEVKRYLSYAELVPVAIEEKKPSEQMIKLMQPFVDKAKFFHEKANESAKNGNYPEALAIIRDATTEVRRGLMAIGVSM